MKININVSHIIIKSIYHLIIFGINDCMILAIKLLEILKPLAEQ
jgi:hypothetical protein